MTSKGPLAEFLTVRRARTQPEDVGLPRDAGRRVEGLRRAEVASLAGISVEYYLRLEQGRDRQPSEQVLAALSRALRLDRDADAYLHRVVQASGGYRPQPTTAVLGNEVRAMLQRWEHTPAYVSDSNLDVLAANAIGQALAPGYLQPGRNLLLDVFAVAESAHDDEDWRQSARMLVNVLRFQADPTSPRLQEILGILSVAHREFRQMWSLHDPQPQTTGSGLHHIDGHGWVMLRYLTLDVPGDVGQHLTTFYADPGTPGDVALRELVTRVRDAQPADPRSAASSANLATV